MQRNVVSFQEVDTNSEEDKGMDKLLANGGNILGLAGVLLTAAAGVGRIMGHYHLAGFESMTLFMGGIGLMVMGCLAKLHVLSNRRGG